MHLRGRAVVVLTMAFVVSCSPATEEPEPPVAPGPGAESATAAVEELIAAIGAGDFSEASRLAVPQQAALASLAEGAASAEVADALREEGGQVAANFWAGFAQGTGNFLIGAVDVAPGEPVTQEGVTFQAMVVTPADGGQRTMMVRDLDGYRVDLFASFGAGLAGKMTPAVERLLDAQTADARLILSELQGIVPSLLVAASLPGTSPDLSQQLLGLVEVITRVS